MDNSIMILLFFLQDCSSLHIRQLFNKEISSKLTRDLGKFTPT